MADKPSEKLVWQPSVFGILATPQAACALVVAWLALALFFRSFPQIDLAVSRFFFDAEALAQGRIMHISLFPMLASAPLNAFRNVMHYSVAALAIATLVSITIETVIGRSLIDRMVRARTAFLTVYLLSPLLFANGLTKPLFGRPRPRQIAEFGGDVPFVPAAEISSYCSGNCSFVSGEAASYAWLFGLLAIVPQGYRLMALVPLVLLAGFSMALRVSFGAHFLSDVVLGGFATLVLYSIVAAILEYTRYLPWIARRLA